MLIIALCVVVQLPSANAGRLTVDEAKNVASDFFKSRDCRRLSGESALTLSQTKTDSRGEPVYYVFGATDGKGFIIVSADGAGMPVIGYSYESAYDVDNVPANAAVVLENKTVGAVKASNAMRRAYGRVSGRKELTTAKWSQEAPFNNLIPGRRPTGCVGTAMAMIMKYHGWPERGRGSLGDVDFNVAYDWNNMRTDNYRQGYSEAEGEAVAVLMSHAAQSIMTDFGMSGSSASEVRVPNALIEYFGYDAGVSYKKGSEMERQAWDNLIMSEIDEGRPVLYCGQDVSVGHAFVCDGYETGAGVTYFHINWGWGGLADGYFASDNLSPQASHKYNFNNLTTIVYNIKPAVSPAEWSPIHLTNDGNQVGVTMDVNTLAPGVRFTLRAGALKNVSGADFSGKIYAGLYGADGVLKSSLSEPRDFSLPSLQVIDYIDLECAVPSVTAVSGGDFVRLVTVTRDGEPELPVASELNVAGEMPALNYDIPYFTISIPEAVEGVEIFGGGSRVIKGRDYEFTVNPVSPDRVVTVKANGFIVTPYAGNLYRLKNVNRNQEIGIIVQNAADVVSKRSLWVSAGKLSTLISSAEEGTVTDLTLFGTIDANDFTFIRERMRLERLDLSGVSIVANGVNPANAIPAKAFKGYGCLREILLPAGLTTFKNGCFNACGLRSIEIPASVSTYEYNIFLNCGSLGEVIVRRQQPAWVNWCVFTGTPKARLVVPVGSADAYKNAENWNEFREIAEENPVPPTSCGITFQETEGVRFTPVTAGSEVPVGSTYEFTVETDESFGDALMEVYANSTRLYPEGNGVYKAVISKNTLIYTNFRQPEAIFGVSPWKMTGAAGGIGLVTDVINVVPGKSFTIRINALSIPADHASLFYAAALTDGKGGIKEIISSVFNNSWANYGDLPCNLTCQVKEASVKEGNTIRIITSYNKKSWDVVKAVDSNICDSITAVGNKVIYHTVTMPEAVQGATIQGAVPQVVRGMPFSIKVTPTSTDDVVTVAVNGTDMIVDEPVANLSIPAVTEDLDITIQVNPAGTDSYRVVNVREGELAGKISQCPSRLKVTGVMLSSDFDAFRNHAATITDLDLTDVVIKGNGDLADAIPTNAFASERPDVTTALRTIMLPSGLKNIEANAFSRCRNISEIMLPKTVSYIGSGAFAACISLKKIIASGTQPPALSMNPFPQNASEIILEVPMGAEAAYGNAAYWKDLSMETSVKYYRIQFDAARAFSYNSSVSLNKIPHPSVQLSHTVGLPNCLNKDNDVIRPGVAFRLYDNGRDVTYTSSYVEYGQHGVSFDPRWTDPEVYPSCPQDHVIDVVFHYGIDFNMPENTAAEFVNIAEENVWKDVKMALFDKDSGARPTLYKEGADYSFVLVSQSSGMETKVKATMNVMTKTGKTPEYTETETILTPDENGVYTILNLQGDTRVDVTTVPVEGAVICADDFKSVDADDVKDVTAIGVSGEMSEEDFEMLRDKFSSLESIDLSGITNETIPDNAFAGMSELSSVTLPDCVTAIGNNAFSGCSGLSSITLSSVTSIGEGAFDGCDRLTSISINTVSASQESLVARAKASAGICDASFRGINPNCLIFVADRGLASSMEEIGNVIYNGDGSRVAVSDITLAAGHPFFTPGSFRLGEKSISCTAEIERGERGNWRGIVLPFVPEEMNVAGEGLETGEAVGTVSFRTFAGEEAERLSLSAVPEANRPYLMRLNGASGGIEEISFSARGTSDAGAYDVPLTPDAGDIVTTGKDFTLYGVYESHPMAEGDYTLDDEGKTLRMADADAEASVPAFGVYMRANSAAAPIMLEIDEALTVGLTDVTDDAVDGVKVLCDGSVTVIISDTARSLPVYDLAGRKVMDLKLKPGRNTVSLAPGVYIVCGEKVIM